MKPELPLPSFQDAEFDADALRLAVSEIKAEQRLYLEAALRGELGKIDGRTLRSMRRELTLLKDAK